MSYKTFENDNSMNENSMNETQIQVNEVIEIMRDNVTKVIDRGEKLEDLEAKSTVLMQSSDKFKKIATKLKNNMCCKNAKITIVLVSIILVFIMIISLIIWSATKQNRD
jgi:hypothetical protein